MNTLQSVQLWEMMRAHQAELLKEAEKYHLARKLEAPKVNWWKNLLRRPAQTPTPTLTPNVTPEIG